MKGKENIEELFKKGLENYQPEVNPSLWDNIQSQMQPGSTPSAPNDGGSSSIVQTMLQSTKFWVATSIVTVATVTTILVVNNTSEESEKNTNQQQELVENTDKNETLDENQVKKSDNIVDTESEVESDASNKSENNTEKETTENNTEANNDLIDSEPNEGNNTSTTVGLNETPSNSNKDTEPKTSGKENQGESNKGNSETGKNPEKVEDNSNENHGEINKSIDIQSEDEKILTNKPHQFYIEENSDILSVVWFVDGAFEGSGFDQEITFEDEGNKTIEAEVTFADETSKKLRKSVSVAAVSYMGGFSNNEPLRGKGSFPNVITPNGDGDNDFLEFQHGNIESFNLIILNKRGQMVYGSDEPDFEWNGTDQSGNPLEDTEFKYMVKAVGKDGQVYNIKESLTIKR